MLPLWMVNIVACVQVHNSVRRTERQAFERKETCSPLVLSLGEFNNQDCDIINMNVYSNQSGI